MCEGCILRHLRLGGKGTVLSRLMAKHSVGAPWSACTIKEAFVVHTLHAFRVMLDQWLTRARRLAAPGSHQVRREQVEAARIAIAEAVTWKAQSCCAVAASPVS